jgi:hypothetical protein
VVTPAHHVGCHVALAPIHIGVADEVHRKEARMRSAMSGTNPSTGARHEPGRYEIRLMGHLDQRWAAWFDGLSLSHETDGTTIIHGPVADQAALHGLLQKVRDTGLPLVSVTRVEPGPPEMPGNEPQRGEPASSR